MAKNEYLALRDVVLEQVDGFVEIAEDMFQRAGGETTHYLNFLAEPTLAAPARMRVRVGVCYNILPQVSDVVAYDAAWSLLHLGERPKRDQVSCSSDEFEGSRAALLERIPALATLLELTSTFMSVLACVDRPSSVPTNLAGLDPCTLLGSDQRWKLFNEGALRTLTGDVDRGRPILAKARAATQTRLRASKLLPPDHPTRQMLEAEAQFLDRYLS